MYENLIFLLCIVLLPTIPAFLLFTALPSRAIVKGVLAGVRIDLGGAFGGYFALVLLLINTQGTWRQPQVIQTWDVDGRLADEQGNSIECNPTNFSITPRVLETPMGGNFTMKIATYTTPGGDIGFPDLMIGFGDRSRTIHLDDRLLKETDLKIQKSATGRWIHLGDVPLYPSNHPPYNPPASTP